MTEKIRTALFGGTFNPLHNGHMAIIRSVLEQNLAQELWLLVTPCNPWKENSTLLSDRIRLEMAQQAVNGMKGVMASDYEFHLPQPSFSANTLRHIAADYPEREFILTIGADNWARFDEWSEPEYIISNFRIIVYPRTGCPIPELPDSVSLLDCPNVDVSSTQIRELVKEGAPVDHLVPESVARSIKELGLYR